MYQSEGYHDVYNYDMVQINALTSTKLIDGRKRSGNVNGSKRLYEFIFIPNDGFLNSNMVLLNDSELKLSFDRNFAEVALLKKESDTPTTSLANKPIEIKDCYAITEYVSSEGLRQHFSQIDTSPIIYNYE